MARVRRRSSSTTFPGVVCLSVNDEVVHGVPGGRVLTAGDTVKIDVTAELDGYMADAAVTVTIPPVSTFSRALTRCATLALEKAIDTARAGRLVSEIGRTVEREVRRHGFDIFRELGGHGVGRTIHERPQILNYFDQRDRQRLTEGLVITIEPIITAGRGQYVKDGSTLKTKDGSLSAHVEHTIVITRARSSSPPRERPVWRKSWNRS